MSTIDEAVGDITAAARTAVTAYGQSRDSELAATKLAYTTQLSALQVANATLQAQVADLQKQIQELENPTDPIDPIDPGDPGDPPVDPPQDDLTIIGMSAPADQWAARLKDVGPGIGARRIFADLSSGGNDQADLIKAAFDAGLIPVISYKVNGDYAGAKSGKYDAAAQQAAKLIASYNKPATVTLLHEPQGDLSGADFIAINARLLPFFVQGKVKVGPLLNGWLLDRQAETTFASFTSDAMFKLWDFVGIDTYEAGTASNPGSAKPGDRIPLLVNFLKKRGQSGKPIVIGEYNGYSAAVIKSAGEAILSEPQVWLACVWNNTGGKGLVLEGDRLTAFRQTLADPRVQK